MSQAFTSAGTTVSVSSSAPATYTSGGFTALTFTNIGEITDIGEFGAVYKSVTHNPIDTRQTVKRKGSYDPGKLSLKMARVPSDAGQAILKAGRDSDASYSFKVVLQNGTTMYFSAQIMSYTTSIGGVDSITAATVDVEIDNNVIEV